MAGPFTHMLICQQASDPSVAEKNGFQLDGELQNLLDKYQPFLLLGSVGPDLPSIHDGVSGHGVSETFHNGPHTNAVPLAAFSALKGGGPPQVEFAFLLGYVAHMIADVVVHPVVRLAIQGQPGQAHQECEICQDTLLFQSIKRSDITRSDYLSWLDQCKKDKSGFSAVMTFWQWILSSSCGMPDQNCGEWFSYYTSAFGAARQAPWHFDGWTYLPASAVKQEELNRYYAKVRLPIPKESSGAFPADVYPRALRKTLSAWQEIYRRFHDPKAGASIADLVQDWNLNSGQNLTTGREFDLWQTEAA